MDAHLQFCAKYSYWCYSKKYNQLLYTKSSNSTYIGFRGVNTLEDIKQALTIVPVKFKNTNVHKGFLNRYLTIKPKLQSHLKDTNTRNVYFIGHSMGGCVAMLAAIDSVLEMDSMLSKNIYCYTFGTPAIGDSKFLDLAHSTLDGMTCVELNNDIVPKLPHPAFLPITTLKIDNVETTNQWDIVGNHSSLAYYKSLM